MSVVPGLGYIVMFVLELDLEKLTVVLRVLVSMSPG
jgi:hypothetical protein